MILLLVEDEPYTREGIKRSIDWNKLGIKNVLCAEDGAEGLKLAAEFSPDIVLTDMRTPRMTGAKMAEQIHDLLPDCAFIFMSGYTDIDYFKSAIHVSAFEYVEKPLKMDQLLDALTRACAEISKYKSDYEYITLSRSRELAIALVQPHIEKSEISRLWELSDMPHGEVKMACLLLDHESSLNIPQLVMTAAEDFSLKAIAARVDSFYLIHLIGGENDELPLSSFADRLIHHQECSNNARVAIGAVVSDQWNVCKSYKSAKRAFNFSFFNSGQRVLTDNPEALSLDIGFDPTNEFGQLILNRSESISDWVNSLFVKIRNYDGTPVSLIRYWVYQMIEEACLVADKEPFNRRLKELNGDSSLWQSISSQTTLEDLRNYMLNLVRFFEEQGDDNEQANQHLSTLQAVKRYIQMHHSNPHLSLGNIAEYVNLSPTYLCNVFKETAGVTVNHYLNSYRMDRARLYLSTSCMQVKEVAEKVGYSNSSYFIKLFRKENELTPQEFRNNHLYL